MKWPDTVIAQIALDEWPTRETATVATAIALVASEGDDAFLYVPSTPQLPQLMGAWAIPWLPEMDSLELDPFRLRDNAKIARIMTGPNGDEWEWSTVWLSKKWLDRMERARQAVKKPQSGISQQTPIPVERFSNAENSLTGLANAALHVLNQTGRAFRQPFH